METGGSWGKLVEVGNGPFSRGEWAMLRCPVGIEIHPSTVSPIGSTTTGGSSLSPRFALPTAFLPWVQAPPPGGAHAAGVATYSRGRCGNCLGGFCRVSFNVAPPHPITITILDVLLCQSVRGQRAVG